MIESTSDESFRKNIMAANADINSKKVGSLFQIEYLCDLDVEMYVNVAKISSRRFVER